mmetsp:Transcript_16574/g.22387  ORF Transcript_16574/g.22387 Transcript_16574/m.22387 type:complete len:97 (-) Transcript_16574:214-504(-)
MPCLHHTLLIQPRADQVKLVDYLPIDFLDRALRATVVFKMVVALSNLSRLDDVFELIIVAIHHEGEAVPERLCDSLSVLPILTRDIQDLLESAHLT